LSLPQRSRSAAGRCVSEPEEISPNCALELPDKSLQEILCPLEREAAAASCFGQKRGLSTRFRAGAWLSGGEGVLGEESAGRGTVEPLDDRKHRRRAGVLLHLSPLALAHLCPCENCARLVALGFENRAKRDQRNSLAFPACPFCLSPMLWRGLAFVCPYQQSKEVHSAVARRNGRDGKPKPEEVN
jgi:hypothetical protein